MEEKAQNLIKPFTLPSNFFKIALAAVVLSVLTGGLTGILLSKTRSNAVSPKTSTNGLRTAQQDTRTFRDFAEGTIKKKQVKNGEYSEGTHILERAGANPVALTSSVVDLSLYEGKKIKVYGETQKALQEGWLMDVGKVEE